MKTIKKIFLKQNKLLQWIIAGICIVCIIIFFWKNKDSLELTFSLDLVTIFLLVVFYAITFILQSWRFRIVILKCSGTKVPLFAWFKIFILGTFLNRVIPQGGNVYRGIQLKKDHNICYTSYISSFISFAWLDTIVNLLISLLTISILDRSLEIAGIRVIYGLIVIVFFVIFLPIILYVVSHSFEINMKYFRWLHSKVLEVLRITVTNIRDIKYLLKIILTGFLSYTNTLVVLYICFRSLDLNVEVSILALFFVILKLSSQFVLTPGNVGVRELAYGLLGEMAGVGMAQALVVSVITRIVGTLIIFVLGTIFGGFGLIKQRDSYLASED